MGFGEDLSIEGFQKANVFDYWDVVHPPKSGFI